MLNFQFPMANFQILLKHLFYFQTGLLFFQATPVLAFCGEKPQIPQKTPTTFILAMGANIGKLEKANSDAQALADAIQKRFNVPASNICILPDVKIYQFKGALRGLQKWVRKQDKVFLYFSGHGTQIPDNDSDENDGQTGCYDEALVISDGGNGIDTIRDDFFVTQVNNIAEKSHLTTIIDSCFSGGMLRGTQKCLDMRPKYWFTDDDADYLPKKDCPSGIKRLKGTVYTASKEYQLAWEVTNGGIFTISFIENMQKHPQATLDEIFDRTAKQVAEQTGQINCDKLQEPQRQH